MLALAVAWGAALVLAYRIVLVAETKATTLFAAMFAGALTTMVRGLPRPTRADRSILSSPGRKSVMVSKAPACKSATVAYLKVSFPAPPVRVSPPPLPDSVSLPAPPVIVLGLASPVRVSLNEDPVRFSMFCSQSTPAPNVSCGPDLARLTVTPASAEAYEAVSEPGPPSSTLAWPGSWACSNASSSGWFVAFASALSENASVTASRGVPLASDCIQ